MRLRNGSRLGPYELVGLLGAGGMGVVYRARDTRLGREVAVKVLPDELSGEPRRLDRFALEARAAAALSHPNILDVHDVGSEDGAPYVVFELLEGETLRERLADGPLSVAAALDVATQVARGLAAAHRHGIVHRDVKPENLLVTRGGLVKILDFGLAKALLPEGGGQATDETATGPTEPGSPLGTAAYMSPEQARGAPVDCRSDLFSLGTVLHEMLTGRNPFGRGTAAETVVAILREAPPPLPAEVLTEAPGLAAVVARCLARDPDDRFQSAADLEFALRALVEAGGPAIRRPAAPRPGWRTAALALGLVAVAAGGLLLARREPSEPSVGFRRLAARPGSVLAARFCPDGHTVLITERRSGQLPRVLEQRLDALGPRVMDVTPGRIVGCARGEVALLTGREGFLEREGPRGLLRAPLQGGPARVVAEEVVDADWARDGSAFATVVMERGSATLQFPPGRSLHETPGWLQGVRVSPDGRRVAFQENPEPEVRRGRLGVVTPPGPPAFLVERKTGIPGLAWSPDGREVWFAGLGDSGDSTLEAVGFSGRRRVLARFPGDGRLMDVGPDGRALITLDRGRAEVVSRLAGEALETELAPFGRAFLLDLSADGRSMLFSDRDAGRRPTAYLRRAGEPAPVRLDDGEPQSLSPDGGRFTLLRYDPESLRVVPTAAGESITLPRGTIDHYVNSRWLPDGRRILFSAQERGRPKRLFLQEVPAGLPRPVTPEGIVTLYPSISPDGEWVAAGFERGEGVQAAWPLAGGEPRPLPGLAAGECVIRWSSDGRHVFAYDVRQADPPWRVVRVALDTGRREVWKEILPPDQGDIPQLMRVHVTPDGRSYAYGLRRTRRELYLVTGLR